MSQKHTELPPVHRLIQALGRDPETQRRFGEDRQALFRDFGISAEEEAALVDGSIPALERVGVNPILRMHWLMMSNPQAAEHMSVAEYFPNLRREVHVAEIVGGFASSHILMSSQGVEDRAARVTDGMVEIGRRLRAQAPDLIVLVTNDHMFNLNLSIQAPFVVGAADSYTPFGDLGVPREPRPGNRAFTNEWVHFAADAGFDLAKAEDLSPDHGVSVPLLFLDPSREIPVVPLYLNLMMDPMPSTSRCWGLGEALHRFLRDRCTTAKRVAIVGAGGLSHWVGHERTDVNEEWDRRFLEGICEGRFSDWVNTSQTDIHRQAGNGGLEIIHWLFMAAATGARSAEVIYYEPMPEWMTGMGGIQVHN